MCRIILTLIGMALWLIWGQAVRAQTPVSRTDSTPASKTTIVLEGYAELYTQYSFNQPESGTQPAFIYSHHRLNEVALNLAYAKATLQGKRYKAQLGLGTGTYMNRNLGSEPGTLKHLWEACLSWQLHPRRPLWIEAGVFLSHIGFEHPASVHCLTLTRSICADNSPYYESGVKFSYQPAGGSWYLAALLLNGWQRIERIPGNTTPAAGLQVTRTSGSWTFNYSNFAGNVYPDSIQKWRHFHSAWVDYQLDKVELVLGLDAGWEQQQRGSRLMNNWQTGSLIGRYQFVPDWFLTGRTEFFADRAGVAAGARPGVPFGTLAGSLGLDYRMNKHLMARAEYRQFVSSRPQFEKSRPQEFSTQLSTVSLALTCRFP